MKISAPSFWSINTLCACLAVLTLQIRLPAFVGIAISGALLIHACYAALQGASKGNTSKLKKAFLAIFWFGPPFFWGPIYVLASDTQVQYKNGLFSLLSGILYLGLASLVIAAIGYPSFKDYDDL